MIAPPLAEPDCWKCRHFFITHEVRRPYGCNAMKFKSLRLPQDEVLAASGLPCTVFSPKPGKPGA